MAKDPHDRIRKQGDKVRSRLGNTTGASKGGKPAPPATTKVKPSLKTVRIKWEKKF